MEVPAGTIANRLAPLSFSTIPLLQLLRHRWHLAPLVLKAFAVVAGPSRHPGDFCAAATSQLRRMVAANTLLEMATSASSKRGGCRGKRTAAQLGGPIGWDWGAVRRPRPAPRAA